MASAVPAVVVARRDGTLLMQNAPARRLMGEGKGELCWEVFGRLEGSEGLPCATGCVGRLLADGLERTQRTEIQIEGRRHRLTCVPVAEVAVCVLNCGTEYGPEKWQLLTPREQEVLALLAIGDETPAVAEKLNVSASTVRTHVEKMRTKFGVKTRAALVAQGFRLGYL